MEASKQTHREWAPGAAPGTHCSPQGEGLGVWGCREVALTPTPVALQSHQGGGV